jgi:hypothetical protein
MVKSITNRGYCAIVLTAMDRILMMIDVTNPWNHWTEAGNSARLMGPDSNTEISHTNDNGN